MKSNKTYLDCKVFNVVGGQYLTRLKGKENKLCEKIKLCGSQIKKIEEQFDLKKRDIDIDHALTENNDPNGAVLKDAEGNYKVNRQLEKDRRKALDKLLTDKVSFEVQLMDGYKTIMTTLSAQEKEVFAGFVLPPLAKK